MWLSQTERFYQTSEIWYFHTENLGTLNAKAEIK